MLYTIEEEYSMFRSLEIEAETPEEAIRKAKEMSPYDWIENGEEGNTYLQRIVDEDYETIADVFDPKFGTLYDHNFEELEKALKNDNDGE